MTLHLLSKDNSTVEHFSSSSIGVLFRLLAALRGTDEDTAVKKSAQSKLPKRSFLKGKSKKKNGNNIASRLHLLISMQDRNMLGKSKSASVLPSELALLTLMQLSSRAFEDKITFPIEAFDSNDKTGAGNDNFAIVASLVIKGGGTMRETLTHPAEPKERERQHWEASAPAETLITASHLHLSLKLL